MLQRNRVGLRWISTHDDHGFGIADVVVAVRHRTVAPSVGDACDGGGMTDASLVIDGVRAPKRAKLTEEVRAFVREFSGAEPKNGVRPGSLADFQQLRRNVVEGLIPRDALPFAAHELHGILQTPVAMGQFTNSGAFCTVRATVDGAIPARFLADPYTVLNFRDDGAANGAMGANALASLVLARRNTARLGSRCFAHRSGCKSAKCSETASRQTGVAQKSPAVNKTGRR